MSLKQSLVLLSGVAICVATAISQTPTATLLVGGDVTWTLGYNPPSVVIGEADPNDPDWRAVPHINQADTHNTKSNWDYGLHFSNTTEQMRYPLRRLAPLFHASDVVFVNLETPLSDTARQVGDYRTPAAFAQALRWSGITAVSLANNHTFDAEQQGFLDTLHNLTAAGVGFVGGGRDLEAARHPLILECHGVSIGFLGYSQFSNIGVAAFAGPRLPGEAPMDPDIIKQDIRRLRSRVDFVAVAVHWGTDRSSEVSPSNREFAHEIIDDGADMVLGGHTPHPKGIEVYHGKVILYSPAHITSGHAHSAWGDNYLVRFTLAPGSIQKVEVLPIAGTGNELAQPFLLNDGRAQQVLSTVQRLSAALDTVVDVMGNVGVIFPASQQQPK